MRFKQDHVVYTDMLKLFMFAVRNEVAEIGEQGFLQRIKIVRNWFSLKLERIHQYLKVLGSGLATKNPLDGLDFSRDG